jgi:hypothetical protein
MGPKVRAEIITNASPILKKPFVAGIGIWMSSVVTHTSAPITADVANSRVPKRNIPTDTYHQNISFSYIDDDDVEEIVECRSTGYYGVNTQIQKVGYARAHEEGSFMVLRAFGNH